MTVLFVWFGSLFIAPLVLAVFFEARERLDDRDRQRRIRIAMEAARDEEDRQVAFLDTLWDLPAFDPRRAA